MKTSVKRLPISDFVEEKSAKKSNINAIIIGKICLKSG